MPNANPALAVNYTAINGQDFAFIDRSDWETWLTWLRTADDLPTVHAAAARLSTVEEQIAEPESGVISSPSDSIDAPDHYQSALGRLLYRRLGGRSPSTALVILMLLVTLLLQQTVTNSLEYGVLSMAAPAFMTRPATYTWSIVRAIIVLGPVVAWMLHQQRNLFRAIVVAAYILTLGLALNLTAILFSLGNVKSNRADSLLMAAMLVALSNILLFAVWYWIVDPPGIDEVRRTDQQWDFLFPQRANDLPGYAAWQPRATDYLFLAFTTTFAFSPTDTLPLTRRAKYLMMFQALISVICISVVVGRAINILN